MDTTTTSFPFLRPKPNFDDLPLPDGPNQLPLADLKRLAHAQLVQRCLEAHTWQNKLLSTINSLQSQNNYWTNLYGYVEQGLTKKFAEMEALRQENKELQENQKTSSSVEKPLASNDLPPEVALRIQRLEDQVRARDLVIELLFAPLSASELTERDKRQQEKSEHQIQNKLEIHRQQLEVEFGLSTEKEAGVQTEGEQEQNARRTGKRPRETGEPQNQASEVALKRPKMSGNDTVLGTQIHSASVGSGGNGGLEGTGEDVDDEVIVELAFQEAFEELEQDPVQDELEDLFID